MEKHTEIREHFFLGCFELAQSELKKFHFKN